MKPENRAHIPTAADHKWRFFHRMGPRPTDTKFGELNANPVIPKAFADSWESTLNAWGEKMMQTAFTIAEMAAIGFDLPKDAFTSKMNLGPHLLAPTASDLGKHGKVDTILAGFHRDLNFITVHGKSRFPGLDIWLRDGTKMAVTVPDGCLLAQAGMEFEHLTGGVVHAGWHEVLVNDRTVTAIEKARAEGRCLWRISSTLFAHIASDVLMEPLIGEKAKYPAKVAGDHVNEELAAIKLHAKTTNFPGTH
jgi:isopenicillin N synthase-like dioxygenase